MTKANRIRTSAPTIASAMASVAREHLVRHRLRGLSRYICHSDTKPTFSSYRVRAGWPGRSTSARDYIPRAAWRGN